VKRYHVIEDDMLVVYVVPASDDDDAGTGLPDDAITRELARLRSVTLPDDIAERYKAALKEFMAAQDAVAEAARLRR
jgi:hypothetical protein